MNLRRLTIFQALSSILFIFVHFSISSAQVPDPSWYSSRRLQPEIEKAVASAIIQMPFRQETAANVIVAPLRYRYTNPNARTDVSFGTGSKTVFIAEWTINVHTDKGRQFIIPSDRLESIFRQKYKPCGSLPIVPGPAPFGSASCAAMKGEGQARTGIQGTAAAWKLKDGYPKPDVNFQNRIKSNPTNSMSSGGFVIVGERNMVNTFSFSPPPAILEFGKTYDVSLRGVSVVPDDQPDCAGGSAMIYTDAPTKSIHDGKLGGSKRANSSFYVIPPCQHPNWVNQDPTVMQNWANFDKLTFEFRPSSDLKEFRVSFVPIFGYREIAAEYLYVPIDNGSEPTFGGEFTGNAAAYDMGSCADIYVTVGLETTLPKGIQVNTQDNIKQIGEAAKKWAVDIVAKLRSAIGPVCKDSPTQPPPPIRYEDPDDPLFPTTWPPEPPIIDRRPPATLPVGMRKLVMYYNYQHNDSATLSTDDAIRAAVADGYQYAGDAGGHVYAAQVLGTVPLKLFYGQSMLDYFTTATSEGERTALAAGYRFVRIEGYVFSDQQPLTVPLKLFWSSGKTDNLTIATPGGETSALKSGYGFARIEGYIQKANGSGTSACGLGARWEVKDDVSTSSWNRRGTSNTFDSRTVLQSGQFVDGVVSLGIVGNQITADRVHSNWGTCRYTGTLGADGTSVSGTYYCPDQVRHNWSGSIRCN